MQNVPEEQADEKDRCYETHMAEEYVQDRPEIHTERERAENKSLYCTEYCVLYLYHPQSSHSPNVKMMSPPRCFNVSWSFTDVSLSL